ncbi:MAG: hypothetical protein V5A18_00155 [Haloarculaceae archaeon]
MESTARNLARTLLVAALVFSAGCLGVLSTDESSVRISVVNQDDTPHAVVVEIDHLSDHPDPRYTDGRTLDANEDAKLAPFDKTGDYRIDVTVDGQTTEVPHTFENGESVTIGIADGAVTVEP